VFNFASVINTHLRLMALVWRWNIVQRDVQWHIVWWIIV